MMALLMFAFLLTFVVAYALFTAHDDDGRHDD